MLSNFKFYQREIIMILSVSRRTDVPNYYSEWFIKRIEEGFLYVRNPINAHQISRIELSPSVVDCIVFWTKNPENMLDKLDALEKYHYYFQFTITGYGVDVEPNIPNKREKIIPTFCKLSEKLGKERVIWRYDPIFLNEKYTLEYHLKAFEVIAEKLSGYTEKVIISFVDLYDKTIRNMAGLNITSVQEKQMVVIAQEMGRIAKKNHLKIESCAEKIDLQKYGIAHGSCIDLKLIERITGGSLCVAKDKNQRDECGCIQSIEVGTYNTCQNGCRYCYANFNEQRVACSVQQYDVNSPLLCGEIGEKDKVTERKVKSLLDMQMSLWKNNE